MKYFLTMMMVVFGLLMAACGPMPEVEAQVLNSSADAMITGHLGGVDFEEVEVSVEEHWEQSTQYLTLRGAGSGKSVMLMLAFKDGPFQELSGAHQFEGSLFGIGCHRDVEEPPTAMWDYDAPVNEMTLVMREMPGGERVLFFETFYAEDPDTNQVSGFVRLNALE